MGRWGRCLIDFHRMLFRLVGKQDCPPSSQAMGAKTLTSRQVDRRLRSHLAGDLNLHISVQLAGTGTDFEPVSQFPAHLFQRGLLRTGRDLDCPDLWTNMPDRPFATTQLRERTWKFHGALPKFEMACFGVLQM